MREPPALLRVPPQLCPHRGRDAVSESETFVHASADLSGVGSGALRDASLLTGLLIAAAGAAGLNSTGSPIVRTGAGGEVSAVLLLDPCHLSIHSFPGRGLALVDILARDEAAVAKALDVFMRRLVPATVINETRKRG